LVLLQASIWIAIGPTVARPNARRCRSGGEAAWRFAEREAL